MIFDEVLKAKKQFRRMVAVILLGIISVMILLLVKDKRKGLKWTFFIITFFLCIRYGWGNDYNGYLESFYYFKRLSFGVFDIESSGESYRNNEFGWVILNRLFGVLGLGFFGLIIILTIFENWAVYRIVNKYLHPNYYWVAVLFFVFSTSFCVNAAMIRMHLTMCMYLFVVDLMTEKRVKFYWLWSVCIMLLGMTIHRSCAVMFLTLPLFYIKLKSGKGSYIWMVLFGLSFVVWSKVGKDFIEASIVRFIESGEDIVSYMQYVGQDSTGLLNSGYGVIFRYVVFVTWLMLLPSMENKQKTIVILGLASYFLEPVTAIAPIAGRFQMYLASMDIIRWAWLFQLAKDKPYLYAIFTAEIAVLAKTFLEFFYQPEWTTYFLHFHTIFGAGKWM